MRVTYTRDDGRVALLLEFGTEVDPDHAADAAWSAVYRALAEHVSRVGTPAQERVDDRGQPDPPPAGMPATGHLGRRADAAPLGLDARPAAAQQSQSG